MKKLNQIGIVLLVFTMLGFGKGQAQVDSIVQITAEVQGLQPVSPGEWPAFATYWEAMPGASTFAPLPCPPLDTTLPVYAIANGIYLVDGTGGQLPPGDTVSAMESVSNAVVTLINQVQATQIAHVMRAMGMDLSGPPGFGDGGGGGYTNNIEFSTFDTNLLWLQITNVFDGTAYANLYNATDQVYAIWSTTDLLTPFTNWQVEIEVWPTNTNCMPFNVATLDRQDLFLRAQDWTGVELNGLDCWWTWSYFGNLSETASQLDSQGANTLGYDETNGLDPNVIYFTVTATNFYVNQPAVPVQVNLTGGAPDYYAVLVNDTNQLDANWQIYAGTNLTVTLGATDGVYQVLVGLKGLPANATQTWGAFDIPFNLDRVPAMLVITNLTAYAGSRPYIDPAGYSTKSLNSLTFVVTNANGGVSQDQGEITGQGCNSADMSHVTNSFQCLDVALTEGTNHVGIQAVDWAGNVTTTNFSYVFDTNGDTTPPAISLIWPQDGMEVSGGSFTLRGLLDDDTATVVGQYVDGSGSTNLLSGLVERGGRFWLENLPLNHGTNLVTVTATDAAGNSATTNLTLIQSGVTLTMYSVDDSQLNQAVVNVGGTVSDPTYAVWVNGVQGTNTGDGTWTANNVPVTSGGTASFDLTAYPPAYAPTDGSWTNFSMEEMAYPNPLPADPAQASVSEDKPPVVYVQTVSLTYNQNYYTAPENNVDATTEIYNWGQGTGGNLSDIDNWMGNAGYYGLYDETANWPADPGYVPSLPGEAQTIQTNNLQGEYYDVNSAVAVDYSQAFYHVVANAVYSDALGYQEPPAVAENLQILVSLFTGGKAARNSKGLFILSEGLTWSTRAGWDGYQLDETGPVPSTEISLGDAGNEDINGNVYLVADDGQNINITPRANRSNYFGGMPAAPKYQPTSETIYPALADTNRARLNLGVGEQVTLSGMPDGTVWSGPGLLATNSGATFFAPSNAPAGGAPATVTATYSNQTLQVVFTVFPPSGVDHAIIFSTNHWPILTMGAGMVDYIWIAPTTVSFYRVGLLEISGGPTNITGVFTNSSVPLHNANTNWITLGTDNSFADIVTWVSSGGFPAGLYPGGFDYDIPVDWQIVGSSITNYFTTWINSVRILNGNGDVSVSKYGLTVTRTINDVITTNP